MIPLWDDDEQDEIEAWDRPHDYALHKCDHGEVGVRSESGTTFHPCACPLDRHHTDVEFEREFS